MLIRFMDHDEAIRDLIRRGEARTEEYRKLHEEQRIQRDLEVYKRQKQQEKDWESKHR